MPMHFIGARGRCELSAEVGLSVGRSSDAATDRCRVNSFDDEVERCSAVDVDDFHTNVVLPRRCREAQCQEITVDNIPPLKIPATYLHAA